MYWPHGRLTMSYSAPQPSADLSAISSLAGFRKIFGNPSGITWDDHPRTQDIENRYLHLYILVRYMHAYIRSGSMDTLVLTSIVDVLRRSSDSPVIAALLSGIRAEIRMQPLLDTFRRTDVLAKDLTPFFFQVPLFPVPAPMVP